MLLANITFFTVSIESDTKILKQNIRRSDLLYIVFIIIYLPSIQSASLGQSFLSFLVSKHGNHNYFLEFIKCYCAKGYKMYKL